MSSTEATVFDVIVIGGGHADARPLQRLRAPAPELRL